MQMNLLHRDLNKPGKVILAVGVISYVLAIAICLALAAFGSEFTNSRPFMLLVIVPFVSPVLLAGLAWTSFWVGTISGVPLVSFTYAFSAMKRNWRSFVGGLLLASVFIAAMSAIANAGQ